MWRGGLGKFFLAGQAVRVCGGGYDEEKTWCKSGVGVVNGCAIMRAKSALTIRPKAPSHACRDTKKCFGFVDRGRARVELILPAAYKNSSIQLDI